MALETYMLSSARVASPEPSPKGPNSTWCQTLRERVCRGTLGPGARPEAGVDAASGG